MIDNNFDNNLGHLIEIIIIDNNFNNNLGHRVKGRHILDVEALHVLLFKDHHSLGNCETRQFDLNNENVVFGLMHHHFVILST